MADDPNEPELQCFKVLVTQTEYRTYTVYADGQEEARLEVLQNGTLDFEVGDDVEDSIEIIDVWEA